MVRCPRVLAFAACAWIGNAAAADAPALLHKHACDTCHSEASAGAGPSWAEVAAKFRGNAKAVDIVARVIRKGRHGNGPWPMPPMPQVPEADAKAIALYVLSIGK